MAYRLYIVSCKSPTQAPNGSYIFALSAADWTASYIDMLPRLKYLIDNSNVPS